MHKLYSELLERCSLFTSHEEIAFYRKMWSSHDFVMPTVIRTIKSLSNTKRIIGLYPTVEHVGFCILSSQNTCLTINSFLNDSKTNQEITRFSVDIIQQMKSSITNYSTTTTDTTDKTPIFLSYYNKDPITLGKNSERTGDQLLLNEITGSLLYSLYTECHSWPIPVRLNDILKLMPIPIESSSWKQKKAIQLFAQTNLGDSFEVQLKRGSSDHDKDKQYSMAAAYIIARYGLLCNIAEDILHEMDIMQQPVDMWWNTSPQLLRIAKAYIAGNARMLLKNNRVTFESVFSNEYPTFYEKLKKLVVLEVEHELDVKEE